MCVVFFFKQKTAYEMRISDWSSDVCSSDRDVPFRTPRAEDSAPARLHDLLKVAPITPLLSGIQCRCMGGLPGQDQHPPTLWPIQSGNCPLWGRKNPTRREPAEKTVAAGTRSEEGRVGKEGVSTCKSRWAQ